MKYYKDKDNVVFAYDDEQLAQVSRLSELEPLLGEKEPVFIAANNQLQQARLELNEAVELLNVTVANSTSDDEEIAIENDKEIQRIKLIVADKTSQLEDAKVAFNQIESEYQPLKDEFDSILPIFFEIRENLKVMKKMSTREVEAYLNPPVSKEQLIAEAEQQKQSLLAEANSAIAPLQDAVDLGIATNEENAQLTAWKTYRVYLNRVDTSTEPDIEWPVKP
ncbi:tail fiber assembly protein [Providencia rettgeri]|uniref:tail fiber assembly protein n=1 Tax=Providencia rettgeri TaxID=587 RepID=UPI002551DE3F|nr:tail fiber assembly protein [Providencia rettgeri]MDK7744801.1 tail fiber assembly protein [Providencia rettgeri]MDK7759731.1 tail fiber assembly protein [Providencia rettgeri]